MLDAVLSYPPRRASASVASPYEGPAVYGGARWSCLEPDFDGCIADAANPLFGPNRFKLGVFSANCDGGLTMSLAPERWPCEWDDIAAMSVLADEAGLEFILPVAKWRGYQGKANVYGRSFETLTHGAALAALTKRIAIFSTVHVPLVTPAFAAKAIATIDHISHGRAGLNIVCGWNQNEFDLHGVTIDPDTRYDHGLEWFRDLVPAVARRSGIRLGWTLLPPEETAHQSPVSIRDGPGRR